MFQGLFRPEARRPRAGFINQVSKLTPHDREILILRIGWDCRSEYEWAKHVGTVGRARDHGVDPAQVAAGPGAAGVDDHDALLMRAADELQQAERDCLQLLPGSTEAEFDQVVTDLQKVLNDINSRPQ